MNDFEHGRCIERLFHAKDKLISASCAFRSAANLMAMPSAAGIICEADRKDVHEMILIVEGAIVDLRKAIAQLVAA